MPQGTGTYGSKKGRPPVRRARSTNREKAIAKAGSTAKPSIRKIMGSLKQGKADPHRDVDHSMMGRLGKALKLARARKGSGRLNAGDLRRAMKTRKSPGSLKKRGGGMVKRGMGMPK